MPEKEFYEEERYLRKFGDVYDGCKHRICVEERNPEIDEYLSSINFQAIETWSEMKSVIFALTPSQIDIKSVVKAEPEYCSGTQDKNGCTGADTINQSGKSQAGDISAMNPTKCIDLSAREAQRLFGYMSQDYFRFESLQRTPLIGANQIQRFRFTNDQDPWEKMDNFYNDAMVYTAKYEEEQIYNILCRSSKLEYLLDDIHDALIYNFRYESAEDKQIRSNLDYSNLKTAYEIPEAGFIKIPFYLPDVFHPFCEYALNALIVQDLPEDKKKQRRSGGNKKKKPSTKECYKTFLFLSNDVPRDFKGRTFRRTLYEIGVENQEPLLEDQWYLEKITGLRTITPIFCGTLHRQEPAKKERDAQLNQLYSLSKMIMHCKPIHVRIQLADLTRRILEGHPDKIDSFRSQLDKQIPVINRNYLYALNKIYDHIKGKDGINKTANHKLKRNLLEEGKAFRNRCTIKRPENVEINGRELAGFHALYNPEGIKDVFDIFPHPDPSLGGKNGNKKFSVHDHYVVYQVALTRGMITTFDDYNVAFFRKEPIKREIKKQ